MTSTGKGQRMRHQEKAECAAAGCGKTMADAPVKLCFRHHQELITKERRESGITDAMQFAAVNLIAGGYDSRRAADPAKAREFEYGR